MADCLKEGCGKPGTFTVKLHLFAEGCDVACPGVLRFPVCDEHRVPEEAIKKIIEGSWEYICVAFEQLNKKRPSVELTKYQWIPWEEAVEFWKQDDGGHEVNPN